MPQTATLNPLVFLYSDALFFNFIVEYSIINHIPDYFTNDEIGDRHKDTNGLISRITVR